MFESFIDFAKGYFDQTRELPLHAPSFQGNEKAYVCEAIDSSFVSSVGSFVDRFERDVARFCNSDHAVAVVNGTAALHLALLVGGVRTGDEVITQPLTFVATCNAIRYCGAEPVFVDVDRDCLGLSPDALQSWLEKHCRVVDDRCLNHTTGRVVRACVPMHTFGLPCRIERLRQLCDRYRIKLIEDAAEALGSRSGERHCGTFGDLGVFSFNGNKTITCGGGGMLLTNNAQLAQRAKHLSTTAKSPHQWAYAHDEVGYNYRMPNLNAALGCAQLEQLPQLLEQKRALTSAYRELFRSGWAELLEERPGTRSNYWLNGLILKDEVERDRFLRETNEAGVMTRPVWQLMNRLPMYSQCQQDGLKNAHWLELRVVNIPSSPAAFTG